MKTKILAAVATLATMVAATSANATSVYADRTTFESNLATTVVDDYSNPAYDFINSNAQMSAVLGETDYTSTGFVNLNIISNASVQPLYCAGCNGSFQLGFGTTSVGNATGVFGVGFNFFNNGAGGNAYTAFVTFGDGSTTNYLMDIVPFSTSLAGFWAITSDLLISSIHFGLTDGGTTTSGGFGIDNLTIGSSQSVAPVPVPASLPLLAFGIAGLGYMARRKRKSA